jgi:hypothetical protein
MPPVSQAQRAAMYAAKAGKSTLGIPQDVGAEFVEADPGGKLPARAPSDEGRKRLKAAMLSSAAPPRRY